MKKRTFLLTILMLLLPVFVQAKVIEADNNLSLTGEHDSTKVMFGNIINSNAEIDGISVFFGNSVTSNGKETYGVFFGNELNINDEIEKDILIFGNTVIVNKSAVLSRDVFITANNLILNADIGRDIFIYGSKVDLRGSSIKGNAHIYAEEILSDNETYIDGTLTYYEDTKLIGLDLANVGNAEKVSRETEKVSVKNFIKNWLINLATNIVCLFIIILIFPKLKEVLNSYEVEGGKVILTAVIGFGVLIFVPVISLVALLCEVTIPLSLILLGLYFIAMYIGWLYASYVIGRKIWSLSKQKENVFLSSIVGLIITELVILIPYIGETIRFLIFILGIGLFLYQFKQVSFLKK